MTIIERKTERDFAIVRIPRLFKRIQNLRCDAGHTRLFGHWSFFHWHGFPDGWARRRVWNFYFFAVHHIADNDGALKSTEPGGWHVSWARLEIKRIYGGFSIAWRKADIYRVGRR